MESALERRLAARLGKRVAAARLDAEMTQSQLAELLGIGEEAVSRIERGAVMLSVPKLFDLAELFRMRVDELLLGASPRFEEQAAMCARRIAPLQPEDRDFVVEMVERLAERLAERRLPKPAEKRARR